MRRTVIRRARKAQLPSGSLSQISQLADKAANLASQLKDIVGQIDKEWANLQENYNDGTLPKDESDALFEIGRQSVWLVNAVKETTNDISGIQDVVDSLA